MIHIQEPLSEWAIVVTELVIPQDTQDPVRVFNTHRFKTVVELRRYLFDPRCYPIARSLRYNVPQPDPTKYSAILTGRLTFDFTDRFVRHQLEFNSAADFTRFLVHHPILAAAVEFDIKKKAPG